MSASPDEPIDDSALIRQASGGERSAFMELFNRYYSAIHEFAYRVVLCSAEVEDIAQDTFVQVARSLGQFRGDASFKNWLYTIATNKARDRLRQRVRRNRLGDELALQISPFFPDAADGDDHTGAAHAAVRQALASLAPALRESVALVYYEGLNHADAARVLGCAESMVSWRIFRAKHKLKMTLRPGAVHRHA